MPNVPALGVILGALLLLSPAMAESPNDGASGEHQGTPGESSERAVNVETLRALSAWIATHSPYQAPPLPQVEREAQAELKQRCFPTFPLYLVPEVKGVYDPCAGVIYLDEAFDPDSLVDRSYLLHELVHHFQLYHQADETAPCRGRLEGEAIRLQLAWLEAQGVADPFAALGIDAKTLQIIERCPRGGDRHEKSEP